MVQNTAVNKNVEALYMPSGRRILEIEDSRKQGEDKCGVGYILCKVHIRTSECTFVFVKVRETQGFSGT